MALTKAHPPDKSDRRPTTKICDQGKTDCSRVHCMSGSDDCTEVHCRGSSDDCTHVYCEHGSDDCARAPCERGDDCVPATCAAGDDCPPAPKTTTPETTAEQPTSSETQGQLPFTGANVLGIGGLGLLLSGGGLLLARRLRRDQT